MSLVDAFLYVFITVLFCCRFVGVFVFVDMQIGVERIIFFVEKMFAMKLFRV